MLRKQQKTLGGYFFLPHPVVSSDWQAVSAGKVKKCAAQAAARASLTDDVTTDVIVTTSLPAFIDLPHTVMYTVQLLVLMPWSSVCMEQEDTHPISGLAVTTLELLAGFQGPISKGGKKGER